MSFTLGISSGALKNKYDFNRLLITDPKVIEFYNYPSSEIPNIIDFCQRNDVKIALHTPVPYDNKMPLSRFCPTGPDHKETLEAIRLTKRTIDLAAQVNAMHVVVHFPSPYKNATKFISDQQIDSFFCEVATFADSKDVIVAVENMTTHHTFKMASDYLRLFQKYPTLRLCLDVTHAYMINGESTIENFIFVLKEYIHSVHLCQYNKKTQVKRSISEKDFKHQNPNEIDIPKLLSSLDKLDPPPILILEPPPAREEDWGGIQKGAFSIKQWNCNRN
ncbi:MAG: sugar phosphate isomerase/epimerase [Ignavibacteriae bacterium]|nr:sugar phosphate isomerase/epimerase [Ignavibacteriota bacterium]